MEETARCPNCGASTAPADAFCPECGHRLAAAGTAPPGPPSHGPPPRFGPTPPHPGLPPAHTKGFFADLFDFGFTDFVTPKVIKFVYVVAAIVIPLAWAGSVIGAFTESVGAGVLTLILGAVVALLWLLAVRITLELTMVIFRIGADIHAIRDRNDHE